MDQVAANPDESAFSEITDFCKHCSDGDIDKIREKLQQNASIIDWKDISGYAPLHWACLYDRTEVVTLLLENGADVLAQGPNEETPFHWAAQGDAIKSLPIILEAVKKLLGTLKKKKNK